MKLLLTFAGVMAVVLFFSLTALLISVIRAKAVSVRTTAKKTKPRTSLTKRLIGTGIIIAVFVSIPFCIYERYNKNRTLKKATRETNKSISRPLVGFFKLPADGERVSQDEQGRELLYRKGEVVRYTQLTSPLSAYVIDPRSIGYPAYMVTSRFYVTANAPADGKVELRAAGERRLLVQAEIIPRRSRRR